MSGPSRKVLRRTGFYSESQGLMERYIRVEGAWDSHLRQTKEFILEALEGRFIGNLAVLGSGWLIDLPFEQLTARAGHLWLYDAVHPAQVRNKVRKYSNVTLVEADLTGGALTAAWNAVKRQRRAKTRVMPEEICGGTFRFEILPDYVISLNVLSQLGSMVNACLRKYLPHGRAEEERIDALLQEGHLKLLRPGLSCLITDVTEINMNPDGGPAERIPLLRVALPAYRSMKKWEWEFDPLGGYNEGKRTVLEVAALTL